MTGEATAWAEWGVVVDRQVWPCATPHIAAGLSRPIVYRTVHTTTGTDGPTHYQTAEWAFPTQHEYRRQIADQETWTA